MEEKFLIIAFILKSLGLIALNAGLLGGFLEIMKNFDSDFKENSEYISIMLAFFLLIYLIGKIYIDYTKL